MLISSWVRRSVCLAELSDGRECSANRNICLFNLSLCIIRAFRATGLCFPHQSGSHPLLQDAGPRLAFVSLRFDKGPVEQVARNVCSILRGRGYDVCIVEGSPEDFGKIVDRYLLRTLKRKGVFVAFCTEDYGECTGNPWATYEELRFAHANGIEIMPLKMSEVYPPQPKHEDAEALVRKVLHMGLTREDCVGVSDEQIAEKVAKRLRRPR